MAIALVHTTGANTLTVTIPSTTAGNCLVVCIASYGSGLIGSISGITLGGSAGNFAALAAVNGNPVGSDSSAAFIWADPNCAGGQTSVVISGSDLSVASGGGGVVIYEISGLPTSSVLDKSSTGGDSTIGSAWSSGATATTTVANEIWIGCGATDYTGTGPSSPWTNTVPGSGLGRAGYQIVTSVGAATYSGTQSTSGTWAAAVVTLKASGGATFQPTTVPVSFPFDVPSPLYLIGQAQGIHPQNSLQAPQTFSTSFSVTAATIHVAAQALGVANSAAVTGASIQVAAQALKIASTVPVSVATIHVAAQSLGIANAAAVTAATIHVAAQPITIVVAYSFPITAATVLVAAQPITVHTGFKLGTPTVLVAASAITPSSGSSANVNITDAAIHVAASAITPSAGSNKSVTITVAAIHVAASAITPTFVTPELIISIAPTAGTDPISGTPYLAGISVYGTDGVVNLSEGALQIATAIANITGSFAAQFTSGPDGQLNILSGGTTSGDSQASINLSSANSSGGNTQAAIFADQISLNSQPISIPKSLSGSISEVQHNPNDPNYGGGGGGTWASGERGVLDGQIDTINANFSAIVTALQNAGIVT